MKTENKVNKNNFASFRIKRNNISVNVKANIFNKSYLLAPALSSFGNIRLPVLPNKKLSWNLSLTIK